MLKLRIFIVQTKPEDVKPQFDSFASNGAQTPLMRSLRSIRTELKNREVSIFGVKEQNL